MDAVIPANQSLSDAIDLGDAVILGINMPTAWSPGAVITFQAAHSINGTFKNVYDSGGNELTVQASASRVICDIPEMACLRFIKIRSGTAAAPIPQAGNRTVRIISK